LRVRDRLDDALQVGQDLVQEISIEGCLVRAGTSFLEGAASREGQVKALPTPSVYS
jgi:hypothetical protein